MPGPNPEVEPVTSAVLPMNMWDSLPGRSGWNGGDAQQRRQRTRSLEMTFIHGPIGRGYGRRCQVSAPESSARRAQSPARSTRARSAHTPPPASRPGGACPRLPASGQASPAARTWGEPAAGRRGAAGQPEPALPTGLRPRAATLWPAGTRTDRMSAARVTALMLRRRTRPGSRSGPIDLRSCRVGVRQARGSGHSERRDETRI